MAVRVDSLKLTFKGKCLCFIKVQAPTSAAHCEEFIDKVNAATQKIKSNKSYLIQRR